MGARYNFPEFRRAMCRVCDIMDLRAPAGAKPMSHAEVLATVSALYDRSPFAAAKGDLRGLTRGELCLRLYDLLRMFGYEHDPCARPAAAVYHWRPLAPEDAHWLAARFLFGDTLSEAGRARALAGEALARRHMAEAELPALFLVPVVRTAAAIAAVVPEGEAEEGFRHPARGARRLAPAQAAVEAALDAEVRALAVLLANQPAFVAALRRLLRP